MARILRKRRPKVSWLPTFGTEYGGFASSVRSVGIVVEGDGEHTVGVVPLTWDYPFDPNVALVQETSMADFIGSAYLLRRIVGKAFVMMVPQTDPPNNPNYIMTAMGIFVARADDVNPQVPIGYATGNVESYDPLSDTNSREPWIWRRNWLLGNFDNGVLDAPQSNMLYGYQSALDGPHVDAKTRRFVNDDNRLFLAFAGHAIQDLSGDFDPVQVNLHFDLRLLGNLRRNRGRSAF